MLSTSSSIEEHERLLVEKDRFPVRIEPGNPFMIPEKFAFLSVEKKLPDIFSVKNEGSLEADSDVDILMNKLLEATALRLKRVPGNAQMINNLGISYLNKGDYDEAIVCFHRALEKDKDLFASIANQAKAYLLRGDVDKALSLYIEMEKRKPNDRNILINIGSLFLRKQDFEKAKDYFEKTLETDAKNVAALNNIGAILLLEKQVDRAIYYFRRALEIRGDFAAALNNMGVCFAIRKSNEKAIKYFLAAHTLDKIDVGALLNLANVYQAKGFHEGAIKVLEDYLKSGRENRRVREALAWSYFTTRNYQNATKQLTSILKMVVSDEKNKEIRAATYNNMAIISQRVGDYHKAEQYYQMSLENLPSNSIPFYNAIFLYLTENKNDVAKILIDAALAKFPDDVYIKEFLGRYYFEMRDYEKCCETLEEAIATEPRVIDSYATLAVIELEVNKDPTKAREILEKGLAFHPAELALLNNLAYSYLMENETDKARQIMDMIRTQDVPFVTATRGLLLIKEGNIQEGQRLYNQARSLATVPYMADLINQKKYLETGKYYLEQGNSNEAARLLKKAVSIKTQHDYYRNEAQSILEKLK